MKLSPLRAVASAIVAAALALAAPVAAANATMPTAASDVSDFSFESFSGEYYLDVDASGHATMRVVEILVARFPDFDQNRGIIRAIPLNDGEYSLDISMKSITDDRGVVVPYERTDNNGFAEFALGTDEFVQGRTTYVLEYTVNNPIRNFADSGGDEFYWDINGNGWQQQFDTVSARVFLPERLSNALTGGASCYLGYYGETDQCELARNDAGTEFTAVVGPVGSYNTLTVAIGFKGGTVVQPQLPRDSWIVQIVPKVLIAIQALLVLFAIVIRSLFWRDARGRGTIIAEYTPPGDSDLLLDANLIGRTGSGLSAQLIDFAVRGLIRIVDTDPGSTAPSPTNRFSIELVTADGASARELRVLVMLFGVTLAPGERVNPGALSASIGASLYGLPASTASHAISAGFRAEPAGNLGKLLGRTAFWVVAAFVPVWIWAAVFDVLEANVVLPALGTAALWIAVPIILIKPTLLTRRGAEAKEYLLGLREYLTIAEEQRMRVLQSPQGALRVDVTDDDAVVALNERLLPYAVLWGVEDRWVDELRARYNGQAPAWLESDALSGSMLRSFSTATNSSVRPIVSSSSGSSWSSSSGSSFSSGSSGGGFSGGGGGGGGGGGR
ncbi:MAG: DUF2207 domain-containing protein [Rhodoglobus sp.]